MNYLFLYKKLLDRCAYSPRALLVLAVFPVFLAGCAEAPDKALPRLNASYEQALERSSDAVAMEPGGQFESMVLSRLERFFTDMTPDSVQEQAIEVYAQDAYLNDNIVGISGLENITGYFKHAAEQSEYLSVEFLDVSRGGADYFIRWKMTVEAGVLSDGEPVISYGVSHFRFDDEGRVLLHRDYWDAATGMYEHLPYLGNIIRYVQSKLAGQWE